MSILQSIQQSLKTNPKTPTLSTTTPQVSQDSQSTAQNVANNLNANSLLMKTAAASGERQAATRGLQNSTIGIEAAQRAMISAATPIAQQDAQAQYNIEQNQLNRQHQTDLTKLQSQLSHNNAMQQLNAQVSANTIGKSIDFAQQITNNFDAQIAGILQNSNMAATDKEKAITQLKASRDSELKFMSAFFAKIPTTQQNWSSFPNLGVPSISIK